jgi:hypothetical protein
MSLANRKTFTCAALLLLALTLVALLVAGPTALARYGARDFIANPTRTLTPRQERALCEYIVGGSCWPGRYTGESAIADGLVRAAIRRVTPTGDISIMVAVVEGYAAGRGYASLPEAVARAVNSNQPNAFHMVAALGGVRSAILRAGKFIDLNAVVSSGNRDLTIACLISLDMSTLLGSKETCLCMLRTHNVHVKCKLVLLRRIANEGVAGEWFAPKEDALSLLSGSGDSQLENVVRAIRAQLSGKNGGRL